jgi:hypothetical protein
MVQSDLDSFVASGGMEATRSRGELADDQLARLRGIEAAPEATQ